MCSLSDKKLTSSCFNIDSSLATFSALHHESLLITLLEVLHRNWFSTRVFNFEYKIIKHSSLFKRHSFKYLIQFTQLDFFLHLSNQKIFSETTMRNYFLFKERDGLAAHSVSTSTHTQLHLTILRNQLSRQGA